MALSVDLLSQFARVTNDKPEPKKETTAYGTAVIRDGKTYVKFDGSDLLTPVSTTTAVEENERVAVQIKNHSATITGNLSSPAARDSSVKDLSDQITEFEIVIADKVSVGDLEAQVARIDQLTTDNVTVKEKLTAAEANIEELTADVADIDTLYAKKAEIDELVSTSVKAEIADFGFVSAEDLEATNADINNLEATYAAFEVATANRLTAAEADIDKLSTNKLDAETANITYAKVSDLNATNAEVDHLDADVADINTLIFGSATGDTIQATFANAVIAQLGNAQIKAAQIESVSASQITAGDIITNNVKVMSEDGKLLISDETIQISDDTRVRVQIGKDASNDYSINIWDAEGNLMFSEGGITDNAIKDAIIRNDMVSEDANISASKLNISSLFTEINDSSETIKSTKIYLDDQEQTLDVAFTNMTTTVENNAETISSQGTAISTIQGQISSKIWMEDIIVPDVNVGGRNLLKDSRPNIANSKYSMASFYFGDDPPQDGETMTISFKAELGEGKTRFMIYNSGGLVSETHLYPETHRDEHGVYKRTFTWAISNADDSATADNTYLSVYAYPNTVTVESSLEWIKLERGNVATDWTPAPEDTESDITILNTQYSEITQDIDSITSTVASHTSELSDLNTKVSDAETKISQNTEAIALTATKAEVEETLDGYYTKTEADAAITVKTNEITSTISSTYATKSEVATEVTTLESAIEQNTESIALRVTKEEFEALEIGGRNYFSLLSETPFSDGEVQLRDYQDSGSFTQFYNLTVPMSTFVGETCRFSFDIISPNGATTCQVYNTNGTPRYVARFKGSDNTTAIESIPANKWTRCEYTVTVSDAGDSYTESTSNKIEIYCASQMGCIIRNPKFEIGTKATDWTPAPEDVDSNINTVQSNVDSVSGTTDDVAARLAIAESTIQMLTDAISMIVTDANGTTLLQQTGSGWSFNLATTADNINSIQNALGTVTDNVSDLENTLNALDGTVTTELGKYKERIRIGVYTDHETGNEEPAVMFYETENANSLIVTNQRILFQEGSNFPVDISDGILNAESINVKVKIKHHTFAWVEHSSGAIDRVGMIWEGA